MAQILRLYDSIEKPCLIHLWIISDCALVLPEVLKAKEKHSEFPEISIYSDPNFQWFNLGLFKNSKYVGVNILFQTLNLSLSLSLRYSTFLTWSHNSEFHTHEGNRPVLCIVLYG